MFQLFHKLKKVRHSLQLLHKKDFSNIFDKVQVLRKQLDNCQTVLQADLFSLELLEKEKDMAKQYAALSKQELDILFQRAKVHNIKKGDCPSSFFFSKAALRKHHNTIGMIQDKGGTLRYGIENVNCAFVEYYTELLRGSPPVEPIPDRILSAGPKVNVAAGDALIAPITRTEIKQALFIEEYFKKGRMMRKVNTTLLALVPKKEVPLTVQDFRPIACCSVVYKTIRKILANRLPQGYNQGLISPRCLIKVDIRKAFDSLQWDIIRQMFHGLGFPPQFVKWIIGCITSTWFSLKINGALSVFFPG
ncbi:uncharacterized protein LOC141617258 [Silene latifolia]|uniref:uncharacterized protein LOC141617258 n=1 Tax=Silene latifolia TaxID=37657 RepID=UPI003D787AF6